MIKLKTNIYHARISLIKRVIDYDKKYDDKLSPIIYDLINKHDISKVIKSDFEWHFGDILNEKDFIFCKLGKIRKVKKKTKYDEKNKAFIAVESNDEDVFLSHILFDKKRHFFLFEERPELGYKEVMWVITETIKKIFDREITIDILPNKLEVNKVLKEAYRVTKARFLLKPSNPDNSDDIKKMDELIKDIKARRAKMEFVNEDGLNAKSSTFNSALNLSNRGFGDFYMDYEYTDGKKHTFNSKKELLKDTIPKPRDDIAWKNKLLDLLHKTIDLLGRK